MFIHHFSEFYHKFKNMFWKYNFNRICKQAFLLLFITYWKGLLEMKRLIFAFILKGCDFLHFSRRSVLFNVLSFIGIAVIWIQERSLWKGTKRLLQRSKIITIGLYFSSYIWRYYKTYVTIWVLKLGGNNYNEKKWKIFHLMNEILKDWKHGVYKCERKQHTCTEL